ncbi:HAD family hydrolase [Nocardioides acrostichi]|uniref:HAD family hydrolase n=1 Tax=Nocardioides acrostichi TaxID=2784339 RepID=A0A930V110_9ACTN|nr:HAD family hydrolase [Nocardioides acrostichi]MBF4163736.1 HAD family hydrolase [Nocardioides acrostichi]
MDVLHAAPRLVATDLDGTLVRSDGSISPYTREVLDALDERDVPVVFVTGRPLRWTREVFEHVGSHGLAIVSNGALVWDVAHDRPVLERGIAPDVVAETAAALGAGLPGLSFALEIVAGWATDRVYPAHTADARRGWEPLVTASVDEMVAPGGIAAGGALKLLGRLDGADPDALVATARDLVGDRVTVTHSSFPLLEISAPDVTKATTLAMLCSERGIGAHEVIAFGDMPNDLPMLAWAGASYAMADAHPEVRAQASYGAPGHDDDGVARVLARLFDL